jgi:hypothetical protein
MPQIVSAVVTNAWRTKLAQIYSNNGPTFSLPLSFSIGEGGWTNPGGGKEPITPNVALTVLSAPGYVAGSTFVFSKNLNTVSDLTFTSPTRAEISCFVSSSEANDDGGGNPPEFFELGIFDGLMGTGTMLAYSTFPIEIKTSSKALLHVIFVDF